MSICKKPFRGFGCGQCLPCRINKKRLWKNRILLESFCHEQSAFLTLTYSDEFLPSGETLVPKHYVDWLKRFRDALAPRRIRYFLVGEYGGGFKRQYNPHYHAIIFGFQGCLYYPGADEQSKYARKKCSCSQCSLVRLTWKSDETGGLTDCAHFSGDAAAYVTGYVTKKMTRDSTDFQRDYLKGRHPEFARPSRMPGLGANFMEHVARSMGGELINDDVPGLVRVDGKVAPLGRYLMQKLRLAYGLTDPSTPKEVLSRLSEESVVLTRAAIALEEKKGGTVTTYYNKERERKIQKIVNIETRFNIRKKGSL